MTEQTKVQLVDAVEDRIKAAGEEWSYPLLIERLRELADELRDGVESGRSRPDALGGAVVQVLLHEQDHALLAGLADALEEALT